MPDGGGDSGMIFAEIRSKEQIRVRAAGRCARYIVKLKLLYTIMTYKRISFTLTAAMLIAYCTCVSANPINQIHYVDLRESMKNGGGPACLRLRVVLTEEELGGVHQGILLTPDLLGELERWVEHHYRDRLSPHDLSDKSLLDEVYTALDELTGILHLGSLYDFQRNV